MIVRTIFSEEGGVNSGAHRDDLDRFSEVIAVSDVAGYRDIAAESFSPADAVAQNALRDLRGLSRSSCNYAHGLGCGLVAPIGLEQ